MKPRVLATDLDGTLIPLEGNLQNRRDLDVLRGHFEQDSVTLLYVTGRHLALIEDAMRQHNLPQPDWMIGNVGTAIYEKHPKGWSGLGSYEQHLGDLCGEMPAVRLKEIVSEFDGLTLQEDEKLSDFKVSYDVDQQQLSDLAARIKDKLADLNAPWSLISSVDPFTGDGLIDLLPRGVSKAHAVQWWCEHLGWSPTEVVFAGDSGNDWAALTAGYHSIVVGNADRQLAERVRSDHEQKQWTDRLHLAEAVATSGVLEGCIRFGLISELD